MWRREATPVEAPTPSLSRADCSAFGCKVRANGRHCEARRAEAIHASAPCGMDCFPPGFDPGVAMTRRPWIATKDAQLEGLSCNSLPRCRSCSCKDHPGAPDGPGRRGMPLRTLGPNMLASPILDNKSTSKPSVFTPAALLREARRQKGLAESNVPPVCILDPDGDLVRQLRRTGARALPGLALLSQRTRYVRPRRATRRHCRPSRRSVLCGARGGGTVRLRLQASGQPDFGGSDRSGREARPISW